MSGKFENVVVFLTKDARGAMADTPAGRILESGGLPCRLVRLEEDSGLLHVWTAASKGGAQLELTMPLHNVLYILQHGAAVVDQPAKIEFATTPRKSSTKEQSADPSVPKAER